MMSAAGRQRPLIFLVLVASVAVLAGTARARSLAELNRELNSISPRVSQATSDISAAGDVIDRLNQAEVQFSAIASSGRENRAQLLRTYNRLESMLESIYQTYRGQKEDCISRIENGGKCDYNRPEAMELRALYPLSWLRYQGAKSLFSDDPHRAQRLLIDAVDGFTQCTLVITDPHLLREDILGRAYAERELGNYNKNQYNNAIADFKQVMAHGRGSAQYKAAQHGLATTYAAMGDMQRAAQISSELATGATGRERIALEMMHLQGLFKAEAAAKTPAQKARYHREAVEFMKAREGSRKQWARLITAVKQYVPDPVAEFGHSSDPFELWLLANVLYNKKDSMTAAKYYLAAARTGRYPQGYKYAVDIYYRHGRMGDVERIINQLSSHPRGPEAQWATYMRYQLARMRWQRAGMKNPKLDEEWARAAQTYLRRYPGGGYASEVRFALAERLQTQRKYAEAAKLYEAVSGNSEYGFAARFNQAACQYVLMVQASRTDKKSAKAEVSRMRKEIIPLLEQTVRMTDEAGRRARSKAQKKYVHETSAHATYMLATLLEQEPHRNPAQIASLLDGFESKYPSMKAHYREVFQWRIQALNKLGRYAQIDKDVTSLVERSKGSDQNSNFIKILGLNFWQSAQAKKAKGDEKGFKQEARLTLTAYKYFEDGVEQGRMKAANLTGTLPILGQAYLALGQVDKAKSVFEQVVKADRSSPDANAGLARIAQSRKDYKDAVNYWVVVQNNAAESDNLWYDANYNLAQIYAKQGRTDAACDQLARGRAQHPNLGTPAIRAKWVALQHKICLDHN